MSKNQHLDEFQHTLYLYLLGGSIATPCTFKAPRSVKPKVLPHLIFEKYTKLQGAESSKWSKWWEKIMFVCPEISRVFNVFRISIGWHYHALQIACPKWHRKNLNFESYNQGWKMHTAQLIHVGKKTQRQTWPLPDSSIDAVPSLKLLKIA